MKENKMVQAIGAVDDRYINEALQYKAKRKNAFGGIARIAAIAACLVCVLGAVRFLSLNTVDSVVSIDINPSIEITVSQNNKVLAAMPLNADAEKVLAGMELKGLELDTAVNAIVGSLLKNGYLDEAYNAINVCVENGDAERAAKLSEEITSEIRDAFAENDLLGAVNSQVCAKDKEAEKLAEKYGVSVGKLYLAQDVSESLGMDLEQALQLSVSELWALADADQVELISKEEALKKVLADAQVNEADVTEVKVKIHETKDVYKYEINFKVGEQKEYKYKVDAVTGEILEYEFKLHPAEKPEPPAPVDQISKAEALAIACKDAGVAEADIVVEEVKHRPAEKEYSIEFSAGLMEYSYVINATDGTIISKEVTENTADTVVPVAKVTLEQALQLALGQANVTFEQLTMCDIKYHMKKDHNPEYKVHFHVDKEHYEYIVDALTGECTEKKRPEPPKPHEEPVPAHAKEEKPVPPHEKKEEAKPEAPEKPVSPHEKEEKPVPEKKEEVKPEPQEPAEPEKPVPPHEKKEEIKQDKPEAPEKPVPSHEKEEKEKPVPPHEKADN